MSKLTRFRKPLLRASLLAVLGLSWLAPASASAEPLLRDRRLFVAHPIVVELGTFGIAGALVRFQSTRTPTEPPYGIAIESAQRGAIMMSYRSAF